MTHTPEVDLTGKFGFVSLATLTQPYKWRPVFLLLHSKPADTLNAGPGAAWSSWGWPWGPPSRLHLPQSLRLMLIPLAGKMGSFVTSHPSTWCQQGRVIMQGQLRRWGLRNSNGWKVKVKADNGPGVGTVRAGAWVCGNTTTCSDHSHLFWTFYKYEGEFHSESSKAR